MTKKLSVTYLHHSGFLIQVDDKLLLFDFYSDPHRPGQREKNRAYVMAAIRKPTVKEVYIFSSHSHRDHFDPDVLTFARVNKPVCYLLSSDIQLEQGDKQLLCLDPDQEVAVNDLVVRTYGSTDEGVSFLVHVGGIQLFHAGDLNWWYWFDESTAEELATYERDFKAIIGQIGHPRIDVAFFPVDPRLNAYEHYGGAFFIEQLKPTYFFPMHFGYAYDTTKRFQAVMTEKDPAVTVLAIEEERQLFSLEI